MIRVGKRIYEKKGGFKDPSFEGFTTILCLTKSSKYGSLGPYELKNDEGHIMENIWQFSKVYEKVPLSVQKKSRYDNTTIWKWPAQTHAYQKSGNPNWFINRDYFKWREAGLKCQEAIRYPVGYENRRNCLFSLIETEDGYETLSYIEARKKIYIPVFEKLVKDKTQFKELKKRLSNGENLLIVEVDGPHQESLNYYIENYGVKKDFIVNDTVLVNFENLSVLLNDDKHSYGHGYVLAAALLDLKVE
jgi:hypothetical protein